MQVCWKGVSRVCVRVWTGRGVGRPLGGGVWLGWCGLWACGRMSWRGCNGCLGLIVCVTAVWPDDGRVRELSKDARRMLGRAAWQTWLRRVPKPG